MTQLKMAAKKSESEKVKSPKEEFDKKVIELKKLGKEKLLEIVQIQPFNYELNDFTAARKALDELKVEYPMDFKVQCEERDFGAGFGKIKAETQGAKDLPGVPNDITEEEAKKADKESEESEPKKKVK